MNVIIKEEIEFLENIKEEIEDEEFLPLQQNNQENWSDTENCQFGEKLLPFEFITLEPIEEEYQYVKKEYEEVLDLNQQKFYSYGEQHSEDKSSDLENDSPGRVLLPFECEEVGLTGPSNRNFFVEKRPKTQGRTRSQAIIDEIFQRSPQVYSILRPGRVLTSGTNSRSYRSSKNDPKVVIRNVKDIVSKRASESIKIGIWKTAQLLMRREQDRKRKALRRAQETEEEKNLRRQKERLARAACRARESLEKKLLRRERDRKAKALARAMGFKGKQRRRRKKKVSEE